MVVSILASLFGLLIPILIVVGVVYLVARSRGGQHEGLTIYDALAAYFYTIIGASMITAAIGVILFLDVALKSSGSDNGEEIVSASTLLGTGVVVGSLHLAGKLLMQRTTGKTFAGIRRVYLFCMLGIASVAGLISLPLAIYSVIEHYAVHHQYYYGYSEGFPSTQTAVAIVVVPLWCYYLYRVIRETSRRNKGEDSPAGESTSAPTTTA